MNEFAALSAESEITSLAQVSPCELAECDQSHEGFPGCGDGSDDLADHNANEADDYRNEGGEDSYLDASYEDRTESDFGGE